MNALCKHALAFARRGFPVIPLYGKIPIASLVPNGARAASVDPETISQWWHLSPSANIGVTLPFCLVVDVDDRNGGDTSLVELQERYGSLPRTWGGLTGGGGEHAYYAVPDGAQIRGGNNRLGPGIDIKTGPGSYVVAPPSRHPSGARYEWRYDAHPCETPLAIAPPWLIRVLTPPPPPPRREFKPCTDDDKRIADALARIPADNRETWCRVGMALKAHYGDGGFDLWDDWSRSCPEKYDRKVCERVWRSFRGNGVGLGSLFYLSGVSRAA